MFSADVNVNAHLREVVQSSPSGLKLLSPSPLSSGTSQQCKSAIDHLKRIIKHKAPSLNQHNAKRRIPRSVLCVHGSYFNCCL